MASISHNAAQPLASWGLTCKWVLLVVANAAADRWRMGTELLSLQVHAPIIDLEVALPRTSTYSDAFPLTECERHCRISCHLFAILVLPLFTKLSPLQCHRGKFPSCYWTWHFSNPDSSPSQCWSDSMYLACKNQAAHVTVELKVLRLPPLSCQGPEGKQSACQSHSIGLKRHSYRVWTSGANEHSFFML